MTHPLPKLWPITVTHPHSKETISFLGQGTTVLEAVNDGVKNLGETYRPNQSGSAGRPGEKGGPSRIGCTGPNGKIVWRSLREFEAGGAGPSQPDAGENMEFA